MPNPRIPESANQDLKEVIKDLWYNIDRLLGAKNVDWRGRRIINAGDAVDPQDYVTLRQVEGEIVTEIIERIIRREIHIDGVGGGGGGSGGGGGGGGPVSAAWPVGSVFISTVPTDPATLLGVGTWTLFAQGRALVGINNLDADFDTVLEERGEKTHVLTCDEIPIC